MLRRRPKSVLGTLGGLLLAVSMLCAAPAAHGANFYWYGENNSTCWQTGQPGSPSQACAQVGASYLLSHMNGNTNSSSGDYCNYYNIGEGLDTANENNQSAFSGFTPGGRPLGSYQEGNHYGAPGPDVCQAEGSQWGQVLRGNSANNDCGPGYAPCGMAHFVSFGSQGLDDRPWDEDMGSPSLVISAEANPHKVEAPNSWGYVCPLFKETGGGGHVLELCLEQWHVGWGQYPLLHEFDEATECNNGLGQVITAFQPGRRFAEMVSGSAETFEFSNNPSPRTFTTRITPNELVLAIEALEQRCGASEKSSHNASEYAIIGVSQGVEGGNLTLIGSETSNLQLHTEYTPRPPTATTEAASEVHQYSATLNGKVEPDGVETHYKFEYGTTTSYGSSVPASEGNAGSGTGSLSEAATISGLQSSTVYHYRLVAKNIWGTSYGVDQTFTTPRAARPATVDVAGYGIITDWRGTDGNLYETLAVNGKWETFSPTWEKLRTAKVASDPALINNPTNGLIAVWRGTDGNLYITDAPKGTWETFSPTWEQLTTAKVTGDPAAIEIPSYGVVSDWRGTDGNLYETIAVNGKWETFSPTWEKLTTAKVASDPALINNPTNGLIAVWRGTDGNLYITDAPKGTWETFSPTWEQLPPGVTVVGDPTAIEVPGYGLVADWRGSDGNLYETLAVNGKWETFSPTWEKLTTAKVAGDPTLIYSSTIGLIAVWRGTDGNLYITDAPKGTWETYSPTWEKLTTAKVAGDAAVVDDPTNGLTASWRGSDGNLYQTVAPKGTWETFSPTWEQLTTAKVAEN
jgi:hypothetical protein